MEKTQRNLMLCGMVFAIALVVSNMVAAKTIATGFTLFGTAVVVPSAVICYFITFLMTDVVGEIWGRKEAQLIVKWGFVCQVIACVLIAIAQVLPAANPEMQGSYEMLLGQNVVFVVASLLAYLTSQSWDVFVFHKIRGFFLSRGKSSTWRWVWNNASTMSSQAIDTVIYITVAFGIGIGWAFDAAMLPTLLAMMVGQYVCKFILAALDTPVFYFLTRKSSRSELAVAEEQA
ncbi:MAG TPA: queuosine precursor transporter [Coriobacteriaceae bacterium]|nr:queuosine precursor transporter [Coriobacteriaceae bacterium]